MTEHIVDRAGFLAALAPDDPERILAQQHARSCAACRSAFAEGLGLVALLQNAPPPPPPTPEMLARAAAAIERLRPGEATALLRLAWASALAVVLAWAFQLTVGSGFSAEGPHVVVSLAVLAIAVAGVTLARRTPRLAVAALVATSAVLACAAGTTHGLAAGIGVRCTFRELWAAGLTWAIATTVARRHEMALGRRNVIALVAAAALAAHAGQHLACEVPHSDAHLLLFHFGGVVLAVIFAAMAARRPPTLPAIS
jgi:hypothetical protein